MIEETISSQTEPMRRPLLGVAFCYLAGILGGVWINGLHFITILAFALFALAIAFGLHCLCRLLQGKPCSEAKRVLQGKSGVLSRFFPGLSAGLVYLAIFLAGWLTIDLRINSPSERYISALMNRPREGVEIIGVVADDPALCKGRRDDRRFWSFAMRIEALNRIGFFQKARGEILVTMPYDEKEPHPFYGERWRLTGALIDKAFSSGFDGAHRMDAVKNSSPCRFLFQVDPQPEGRVRLARSPSWNVRHWCFILRQKCADTLARGIAHRPDVAGILQALLLGRRYELPDGLREAFVATGTYHVFAISGQHVAIIAMFMVVVLQAYGIGRLYWFYYLAPALIVFTIMAGLSTSAVRGCIMALMCFLGPMFKRKTDISSAMALAALLIVGADPLQLFQAGFILSFGIVAGLIILCPPLIAMVEGKIAPDPCRLEPENFPARKARGALRWILFMLTASFAAWLVSMPLIASWFNMISLIALPANLIVIPMTTLILLTGCLSVVFGLLCPFVAEVFNFANVALVSLTTGLTIALAQVPFGYIFVRSPPIWFVCLWLGVLVVWRVYYQKIKIWLVAVLVLLIAGALMWRAQRNEWEIHVFNVDQCAVCLVNKAGSEPLLLNAGPKYQARNILRYLRKMGVNRIQTLVCPFPDAKHIGGAKDIIAAVPVSKLWRGAIKPGAGFMKELCSEVEKRRIEVDELTNGITPVGGQVSPGGGQVWRIRSGRDGWSVDLVNGGHGAAQDEKENLPSGCPDGPLTIFIHTSVQTQMTARILIATEQTPLVIDVAETPGSGFMAGAGFVMPAEAQCRVLCCPAVEERMQNYDGQPYSVQPSAQVVLGPGQGILFRPDKDKLKMEAINLLK